MNDFSNINISSFFLSPTQESDDRHSVEVGRLAEQVRVCEGVLAEERRGHTHTRGEVTRLTQELEDMRESLLREKTTTVELSQVREGGEGGGVAGNALI